MNNALAFLVKVKLIPFCIPSPVLNEKYSLKMFHIKQTNYKSIIFAYNSEYIWNFIKIYKYLYREIKDYAEILGI